MKWIALACMLMVFAAQAFAHAFLERAIPPVGSTIPVSPPAVTITFTEGVESGFSAIEVRDARGAKVDRADLRSTGNEGRQLTVSLPKLPAGKYDVIWHATSVDTHKTEGQFSFTILP
jgi:methionine-rich copper-binding protein CopC